MPWVERIEIKVNQEGIQQIPDRSLCAGDVLELDGVRYLIRGVGY